LFLPYSMRGVPENQWYDAGSEFSTLRIITCNTVAADSQHEL
jgi:hypothetical protein